jgi:hypothetical protein
MRLRHPRPMLGFLEDRASERKLRLFMVACVRRVWDLLTDERSRKAVEVVERLVDGGATDEELEAAKEAAREVETSQLFAVPVLDRTRANSAALAAERATVEVTLAPDPQIVRRIHSITMEARTFAPGLDPVSGGNRAVREGWAPELRSQADLLRDIFGPLPFRPVTVHPSWLGWKDGTVVQLARSIYEDRRFQDLPILADALEEAGCTNPDILGHCRSGGDHVRGCWVVDLILGKG